MRKSLEVIKKLNILKVNRIREVDSRFRVEEVDLRILCYLWGLLDVIMAILVLYFLFVSLLLDLKLMVFLERFVATL